MARKSDNQAAAEAVRRLQAARGLKLQSSLTDETRGEGKMGKNKADNVADVLNKPARARQDEETTKAARKLRDQQPRGGRGTSKSQ
jgi:hypothetical protein